MNVEVQYCEWSTWLGTALSRAMAEQARCAWWAAPARAGPALQRVQAQLDEYYTAARLDLFQTASVNTLTESERCRIERAQQASPPQIGVSSGKLVAAVQRQQLMYAQAIGTGCPASQLPPGCSIGERPSCAWQDGLPLQARQPLLRHAIFASADGESHLVEALTQLLVRNLSLLVVGDSTAGEVVTNARCEVARRDEQQLDTRIRLAHPHGEREPSDGLDSRLRALNASLEQLAAEGGGVALLSIGVHFNQPDRAAYSAYLDRVRFACSKPSGAPVGSSPPLSFSLVVPGARHFRRSSDSPGGARIASLSCARPTHSTLHGMARRPPPASETRLPSRRPTPVSRSTRQLLELRMAEVSLLLRWVAWRRGRKRRVPPTASSYTCSAAVARRCESRQEV